MSAALELALLGPPQVRVDGQPLTEFKTLKAQALLFYLAVTGHGHPRSTLAGLLWGEMAESNARVNLSKALSELRTLVGPHVSIERQQVGFDSKSDYWLDLRDLEAAADALEHRLHEEQEPPDAMRPLGQLGVKADLYRGDFLDGFYVRDAPDFELWLLAERGRQREQIVQMLHRLVESCLIQGGWQSGIGYARRLVAIEPWREIAHRQLMRLLARSGQRAAAIAQFEACRHILGAQLDVEPDATTIALVEQIRAGGLGPESHTDQRAGYESTLPIGVSPQPAFLEAEIDNDAHEAEFFVGCERELQALDGYLQRALDGSGRVIFVTGEAGSGKTALIRAFTERAMAAHPRLTVAHGICNAYTGMGDPYLPFREIMSMLAGRVENLWASGAIRRQHALRLWHLMPAMVEILLERGANLLDTMLDGRGLLERAVTYELPDAERIDQLVAQISRQQNRAVAQEQLFQQYGAVMRALSRRFPLLLVLDDLHWADASSLALLFYLARSIDRHPILILSAYRPEEPALFPNSHSHSLAELFSEFQRRFGEIEVSLDDRPEADNRHFVDSLLDSRPNKLDRSFRQSLFARSQGHPLFTLELLHDMQERQILARSSDGFLTQKSAVAWDTLPARVEGAIERRMSRLDPVLREMLDIAAVEGEIFTAEIAARIQGLDNLRAIRNLAELDRTHRLVVPSGIEQVATQRLSKYRFRHNLFQQYLYTSLNDVERAYLHEQVGNELQDFYEGQTDAVAVQLGRHFQAAGQIVQAIRYWQQAGDVASRLYAHAEAVDSYRRALDVAKAGSSHGQFQLLFSSLGRALELNSQFDKALEIYVEMEAAGIEIGDQAMELQALLAQAILYTTYNPQHDLMRGEVVSERALELAREIDDEAAEAKILGSLITLYSYGCHWEEAIQSGQRSIEIARRINLPAQLALSLNDLGGQCYEVNGQLTLAKETLGEAQKLWHAQGNLAMLADSLGTLAAIAVWEGEYEQALRIGQEALQINQEIDSLWGQCYSQYKLGWVHWDRGRPDLALATMQESLNLAKMSGFGVPQVITQADFAMVYAELGDSARALDAARLALQHAETQGLLFLHYALGALAQVRIQQGQLDEAQVLLSRAKLDSGPAANLIWNAPALVARALLVLKQKEYVGAVDAAQRLARHSATAHRPTALLIEAQALLALRDRAAAYARLVEARMDAERIGSRRTLWRILHLLAEIEPDRSESARIRTQAQAMVRAIVDHIPRADLRVAFLRVPQVRRLLDGSTPV